MSKEYKVSIPLFEPNELTTFDNHIHEIIEEYSKMMFKEKDQILTQRIIMKQEQEIERLNKKIEQYENPEDMTLMFMWCDEKAKDEIKRLNNIINELKKGIENMYVDDAGEDIWEYEEEYLYREEFLDKIEELKGSDK